MVPNLDCQEIQNNTYLLPVHQSYPSYPLGLPTDKF